LQIFKDIQTLVKFGGADTVTLAKAGVTDGIQLFIKNPDAKIAPPITKPPPAKEEGTHDDADFCRKEN
jgi:hypothetical protein